MKFLVLAALGALASLQNIVEAQTTCTALPSRTERLANVTIVTDLSCWSLEEVGCLTTVCRYCRLPGATGYTYLLYCSEIAGVTLPEPTTVAPAPTTVTPAPMTVTPATSAPTTTTPKPTTATPAPTTATPKPTTVTPAPTTATPKPTTATPKPTTATPKPTTTTPKPTTATPKPMTTTPKPTTLAPTTTTPKPTTQTPAPTTSTPKPTTVTPAPTTSTPAPTTSTPKPTTVTPPPTTVTPPPTTVTPAPTTITPALTTVTPSPTTATPPPTTTTAAPPSAPPAFELTCSYEISEGDALAGIGVANDVSCCLGGLGCVSDVCRLCRALNTTEAAHLMACSGLSINNGDNIDFVTIPTIVDDSGLPGSVSAPIPTTASPSTAPMYTPQPSSTSSDPCVALVASGDQDAGISAVSDTDCASGGLGCFTTSCRYCMATNTTLSAHLMPCTSIVATALYMQATMGYEELLHKEDVEDAPSWTIAAAASAITAMVLAVIMRVRSKQPRYSTQASQASGSSESSDVSETSETSEDQKPTQHEPARKSE